MGREPAGQVDLGGGKKVLDEGGDNLMLETIENRRLQRRKCRESDGLRFYVA